LHCGQVVDAAAAGKQIFCEKPMATNVADCDRMIEAADRAGVNLMIGQVLRFFPCWGWLIERVGKGDLGEPLGVQVTRMQGSLAKSGGWRADFAQTGGMLLEINAHELDFMRCVCGDAKSVFALANVCCDPPESGPDFCFVSINYESGAIGLLHSTQCSAIGDLSGKIQCREGTIRYQDGFSAEGVIEITRFDGGTERVRIGDVADENPAHHEVRLFVESLRASAPSPISGVDGKRVVELAQAAYLSAQRGEPVPLPLTVGVDITD
jgi:myo-inositol 2-dehydrogenase/D-chiro-inositol 1-dehydrogenase